MLQKAQTSHSSLASDNTHTKLALDLLRHWVHLGAEFGEGGTKCTSRKNAVPRAEKLRWLKSINQDKFCQSAMTANPMQGQPLFPGGTCMLSDLAVEQLFYIVTGLSPKISVKDLDVTKKAEL